MLMMPFPGSSTATHQDARGNWQILMRHFRSYLPDWTLAFVFWLLADLLVMVSGYKREFSLKDISIQHSFTTHERVPPWMLLVLSALAPAILIPCICFLSCRSLWDLHHAWLGLAFSLSLAKVVTTLVKITVGRPRPDLISRCQPLAGSQDNESWGFSNYTICTQTDMQILKDGFRSFPSGHSSTSFAGLGFLTFYLIGKLQLWNKCGYTWKAWLALVPVMTAVMVAISRTMDYRHHWEDVVVGSALGMTLGYFSYRQFFPSLTDPASHQPFSRLRHSTVSLEGTDEETEPLTGRNREEGV